MKYVAILYTIVFGGRKLVFNDKKFIGSKQLLVSASKLRCMVLVRYVTCGMTPHVMSQTVPYHSQLRTNWWHSASHSLITGLKPLPGEHQPCNICHGRVGRVGYLKRVRGWLLPLHFQRIHSLSYNSKLIQTVLQIAINRKKHIRHPTKCQLVS